MKTSLDIPDDALAELLKKTGKRTKKDAIVEAINFYNARKELERLTKYLGTCKDIISNDELLSLRKSTKWKPRD